MIQNKSICAACAGTGEVLNPIYDGEDLVGGEYATCSSCCGVGLFLRSRTPEKKVDAMSAAVCAFEKALKERELKNVGHK